MNEKEKGEELWQFLINLGHRENVEKVHLGLATSPVNSHSCAHTNLL